MRSFFKKGPKKPKTLEAEAENILNVCKSTRKL